LTEIEHRPGLDEMLSRWQASISFVKHFPLFTSTPGLGPLFFCFGQARIVVHRGGLLVQSRTGDGELTSRKSRTMRGVVV
jgi:hypothetical protein